MECIREVYCCCWSLVSYVVGNETHDYLLLLLLLLSPRPLPGQFGKREQNIFISLNEARWQRKEKVSRRILLLLLLIADRIDAGIRLVV